MTKQLLLLLSLFNRKVQDIGDIPMFQPERRRLTIFIALTVFNFFTMIFLPKDDGILVIVVFLSGLAAYIGFLCIRAATENLVSSIDIKRDHSHLNEFFSFFGLFFIAILFLGAAMFGVIYAVHILLDRFFV